MAFHDGELLVVEGAWLEQDGVRYAHLADVVEEGPVAHRVELRSRHPEGAGEPHGHVGDAPRVPLGLAVPELEGLRPAFDRGLVGLGELGVGQPQPFEEARVVQGHRRLAGQGLEVELPARVLPEGTAAVELEDAFGLALHGQLPARIEEEALLREGGRPAKARRVGVEVRDDDGPLPLEGPPREALSGAEPRVEEGVGAETGPGRERQEAVLVEEEDVGGIHAETRLGLLEDEGQHLVELGARGYREVYRVQRLEFAVFLQEAVGKLLHIPEGLGEDHRKMEALGEDVEEDAVRGHVEGVR